MHTFTGCANKNWLVLRLCNLVNYWNKKGNEKYDNNAYLFQNQESLKLFSMAKAFYVKIKQLREAKLHHFMVPWRR